MKVITSLPPDFSKRTMLDPSKNPKFIIGAIVTGIALLLVSGWLLLLFTNLLRPAALDGLHLRNLISSTSTATVLDIRFALFRNLLIVLVTMLIIHELMHGLFYWLLSRRRPKFGIHGLFPYAAAPTGIYFPRNQFLTIGLAPLVLLSAVGLLLIVIAPMPCIPFLFLFMVLNAAGAAGDLIMVIQLMSFSPETMMSDNDVGVTIYGPSRNKNAA